MRAAGRHRSVCQDAALLRGFVQEHRAVSLVVGLPLDLRGQEGPACQKVRAYARQLLRSDGGGLGLGSEDVVYWDERFTTRLLTKHTVQVRSPPPATHPPTSCRWHRWWRLCCWQSSLSSAAERVVPAVPPQERGRAPSTIRRDSGAAALMLQELLDQLQSGNDAAGPIIK